MNELERITRRYAAELVEVVGPDKDVPAPDVNTTPQVMAWFMDTYSMHVRQNHARRRYRQAARNRRFARTRRSHRPRRDDLRARRNGEMGIAAETRERRHSRFRQRRHVCRKTFRRARLQGRRHLGRHRARTTTRTASTSSSAMEHVAKNHNLDGFKGGDKITNAELLASRVRRSRAGGTRKSLHRRKCARKSKPS